MQNPSLSQSNTITVPFAMSAVKRKADYGHRRKYSSKNELNTLWRAANEIETVKRWPIFLPSSVISGFALLQTLSCYNLQYKK